MAQFPNLRLSALFCFLAWHQQHQWWGVGAAVVDRLPGLDAPHVTFTRNLDQRSDFIAVHNAVLTRAVGGNFSASTIAQYNQSGLLVESAMPEALDGIDAYVLYFSNATTAPAAKLLSALGNPYPAILDNIRVPDASDPSQRVPGAIVFRFGATRIPAGAVSIIVTSKNFAYGEKINTSCVLLLSSIPRVSSVASSVSSLLSNTTIATMTNSLVFRTPMCDANVTRNISFPFGVLEDGSVSQSYVSGSEAGDSYVCRWHVTASNVRAFVIAFTELDVHPNDYLLVLNASQYRIANLTSPSSATTSPLPLIQIPSNEFYVEFHVSGVSGVIGYQGFRAVYQGLTDNPHPYHTGSQSWQAVGTGTGATDPCVCQREACQLWASNCVVNEGNGRGWATCANHNTCLHSVPCSAPLTSNIDHSSVNGTCKEGDTVLSLCTPQCATGYSPNVPVLTCLDGALTPAAFICS